MNPALAALLAAVLFGVSTPLAKFLLGGIDPLALAAILYLGSGIGLYAWRGLSRLRAPAAADARFARGDIPWLLGAIVFGGVLGPILLLYGLRSTAAASASLLLNLEGVFTAALAAFWFGEHLGRRIILGLGCIVAGGVVLAGAPATSLSLSFGALSVVGACFAWALDNNLTRHIATADAVHIAALKGLAAGTVNAALAFAAGAPVPAMPAAFAGLLVGALGYGLSLVLFVRALRGLGATRTAGYFAAAPFVGAAVALAWLQEPIGAPFVIAAALMALGVWLHLSEHHEHPHAHEALVHDHVHRHDDGHHAHDHDFPWEASRPHAHRHAHQPVTHAHPHYPDAHHRHRH